MRKPDMARLGFSRRQVLKGLGLGAGAALLSPLYRSATAFADGGAPGPKRLCILYYPNGTVLDQWRPTGTSPTDPTQFTLGPILKAFDPLRSDLVILDGLDMKVPTTDSDNHARGMGYALTGCKLQSIGSRFANGPSIDQLIANDPKITGGTRFKNIVLGDQSSNNDTTNEKVLSFPSAGTGIFSQEDPFKAYDELFGGFVPGGGGGGGDPKAALYKKGILDYLEKDHKRLYAAVPADQRPKLDAHLEAIRGVERSLGASVSAQCKLPAKGAPLDILANANFRTVSELQLELLRAAFVCDLTRVALFQYTHGNCKVDFNYYLPTEVRMYKTGYHRLGHEGGTPVELGAVCRWFSERIATFITALKNTPEGTGNMLGNTLVLVLSEMADGPSHSFVNSPFLLFGQAGGKLKTGRYLNYPGRASADLLVSILNLFGQNVQTIGDAGGCQGPLPGLV